MTMFTDNDESKSNRRSNATYQIVAANPKITPNTTFIKITPNYLKTHNSYIRQNNSALKYRIILSSILMT
ncbi:hypothetical protein VCHA28FP16_40002 [Vibrio chagasii]|nr:hypothetical protein VCHA28FP16_40002 [Vibrio chagasii]